MKTIIITKNDLNDYGFYIGSSEFDGSVEIEAGAGVVRFKESLTVKGCIVALSGSDIYAQPIQRVGKRWTKIDPISALERATFLQVKAA